MEKVNNSKKENTSKVKYLLIALVVILFLGCSYAIFTLTMSGSKNNIIKVGALSMNIDNEENNITLTNDVPFTDNDGLKTTPYTFKIINNGDYKMSYNLYLTDSDITEGKTRIEDDYIRYRLDVDSVNGTIDNLGNLDDDDTYGRIIFSDSIDKNQEKSFALRIWVDGENMTSDQSNTDFSAHISLKGTQYIESGE